MVATRAAMRKAAQGADAPEPAVVPTSDPRKSLKAPPKRPAKKTATPKPDPKPKAPSKPKKVPAKSKAKAIAKKPTPEHDTQDDLMVEDPITEERPDPAPKKRGRPKKVVPAPKEPTPIATHPVAEDSNTVEMPKPAPKRRGRPKKTVPVPEEVDELAAPAATKAVPGYAAPRNPGPKAKKEVEPKAPVARRTAAPKTKKAIATPQVDAEEVAAPKEAIATPQADAEEVAAPEKDIATPQVDAEEVAAPEKDIATPQVDAEEVAAPVKDIATPQVDVKEVAAPVKDIATPQVDAEEVAAPKQAAATPQVDAKEEVAAPKIEFVMKGKEARAVEDESPANITEPILTPKTTIFAQQATVIEDVSASKSQFEAEKSQGPEFSDEPNPALESNRPSSPLKQPAKRARGPESASQQAPRKRVIFKTSSPTMGPFAEYANIPSMSPQPFKPDTPASVLNENPFFPDYSKPTVSKPANQTLPVSPMNATSFGEFSSSYYPSTPATVDVPAMAQEPIIVDEDERVIFKTSSPTMGPFAEYANIPSMSPQSFKPDTPASAVNENPFFPDYSKPTVSKPANQTLPVSPMNETSFGEFSSSYYPSTPATVDVPAMAQEPIIVDEDEDEDEEMNDAPDLETEDLPANELEADQLKVADQLEEAGEEADQLVNEPVTPVPGKAVDLKKLLGITSTPSSTFPSSPPGAIAANEADQLVNEPSTPVPTTGEVLDLKKLLGVTSTPSSTFPSSPDAMFGLGKVAPSLNEQFSTIPVKHMVDEAAPAVVLGSGEILIPPAEQITAIPRKPTVEEDAPMAIPSLNLFPIPRLAPPGRPGIDAPPKAAFVIDPPRKDAVGSPLKSALRSPQKFENSPKKKTVSFNAGPLNAPSMTPSATNLPLENLIFFLDVNSKDIIKNTLFVGLIGDLGGQVMSKWEVGDKINPTHVLFKEGTRETLQKVIDMKGSVKCVDIGFIMDTETHGKRMDESKYLVDLDSVAVRASTDDPRPEQVLSNMYTPARTPSSLAYILGLNTPGGLPSTPTTPNSSEFERSIIEDDDKENDSPPNPIQQSCPPKSSKAMDPDWLKRSPVKLTSAVRPLAWSASRKRKADDSDVGGIAMPPVKRPHFSPRKFDNIGGITMAPRLGPFFGSPKKRENNIGKPVAALKPLDFGPLATKSHGDNEPPAASADDSTPATASP